MHSSGRKASIFLLLVILFSVPAVAQVAGGTFSGTVSDPSGGGIPKATVLITNSATGVENTVSTNNDGLFKIVNLLPGKYRVKVFATGFATETNSGITISRGAEQIFDVTLRVGTVSNRIEVTTEAPAVELTTSDMSAEVNATTVRELPLNGRR